MAIFHLNANIKSRGAGHSAIAASAYRTASRLVDPNTQEVHDFTRRKGVAYSEIIAPDHAPAWMRDRQALWGGVELAEKRKDAQLAREIELALPHELTDAQRRDLVCGFVRHEFVARGMVADVAIHRPGGRGDARNHHAHVLLTMREITPQGFGKKVRAWNDDALLRGWRESWSGVVNRVLEQEGHEARIDHRSLEAQGIDRIPTEHVGRSAYAGGDVIERQREIANDNDRLQAINRELTQTLAAIAELRGQGYEADDPKRRRAPMAVRPGIDQVAWQDQSMADQQETAAKAFARSQERQKAAPQGRSADAPEAASGDRGEARRRALERLQGFIDEEPPEGSATPRSRSQER